MHPKVSILLPVHNALGTLPEALQSLKNQTLADFELILVDDGSTDGCIEAASKQWGADPRLRLLSVGRVGLVQALNLGLQACRAELIARMDADDLSRPTRLTQQLRLMEVDPDLAIASCLVHSFLSQGVREGYQIYDDWLNSLVTHEQIRREIFVESPLAHPSVMYRRRVIEALGGYEDHGWPEDYDLWMRAAMAGYRFAKVPEVLLDWRDTAARFSRVDKRYSRQAFMRLRAHYLVEGPLKGVEDVVIWGAGPSGRRLSRVLSQRGLKTSCFIDIDPRKIGKKWRGVEIQAPEALVDMPGRVLLASVAARGARALIRERACAEGWTEGVDLFCVC
jgi:glycosyltransferase involved in cell wall biosynthesis